MARIHYLDRLLLDASAAAPPSSAGKYADANFDSNMVIILAALLCALICALGLNSIVRCALRCGRRSSFDDVEDGGPAGAGTAAMMAATGLKKEALSRIPVAAYESGTAAAECPICLGEFAEGEKVRVLPKCRHGFHVKCVDTWLESRSSCPVCRQLLFDGATVEDGQVRI